MHTNNFINACKHPTVTSTPLGNVYTRVLVVLSSSSHQRVFVCGSFTGTAQIGVSLESLLSFVSGLMAFNFFCKFFDLRLQRSQPIRIYFLNSMFFLSQIWCYFLVMFRLVQPLVVAGLIHAFERIKMTF